MSYTFNYKAPPTVAKFMRSDAFFRVMHGPLGSGKTSGCIVEIMRRCMEMTPGEDGVRRSRWLCVRATNAQLKDTVLKSFFDWFPPNVFGRWKASEMTYEVKFGDVVAEILFRPLESIEDVQRVLSLELTGCFIEESREIDVEILMSIMGRIGRYPSKKTGIDYWYGMICSTNPPAMDSAWEKLVSGRPQEEGNDNSVIKVEVFCQPSGLSPEAENTEFLPDGYYDNLAEGKPKHWVDTYIHGMFSPNMGGRPVYQDVFKQDRHVREVSADNLLPVVIGFDTGLTPAFVFKQMGLDGRVKTLRELALFDMGMKRACEQHVRPILKNFFPNNQWIFIGDPAGVRRADSDESTAFQVIKKVFSDAGVIVKPAVTNDPSVRIQSTEQMLSQYPDGEPLMVVSPHCRWYIEGLRSKYRYAKVKGTGNYHDKPEKNDWSHVVEAGQYCDLYLLGGKFSPSDYIRSEISDDPFGFHSRTPYRPASSHGY